MSGKFIERQLYFYPDIMRIWIESLGPVEEILDIRILNEVDIRIFNEVFVEEVKSWKEWKPIMHRTIMVFHKNRQHTQRFIQKNEVWYLAKE